MVWCHLGMSNCTCNCDVTKIIPLPLYVTQNAEHTPQHPFYILACILLLMTRPISVHDRQGLTPPAHHKRRAQQSVDEKSCLFILTEILHASHARTSRVDFQDEDSAPEDTPQRGGGNDQGFTSSSWGIPHVFHCIGRGYSNGETSACNR